LLYVKTAFCEATEKASLYSGEERPVPRPAKQVVLSKKEVGERLRTLREERRMTQVELAEALGTHQASLSQVERGIRGLTLQQVVKIARALRVSPDRLLGEGRRNGLAAPSRNERLMRRVRRIEQLSSDQQDAAIKMLDAFLESRSS
jgi:transcriptional regulator with XRE-family HTH domain